MPRIGEFFPPLNGDFYPALTTAKEKTKKYRDTEAKQNTRIVIYSIIDKYDELCSQTADGDQTVANQYATKIKNPNRLAISCMEYAEQHYDEVMLRSGGKIRELIKDMMNCGNLLKVDGLIRRNRAFLNSEMTTGNIFTVIIKPEFVSQALKELNERLYDYPVMIQSPCSNLIQIIELGDYTPTMNEELELSIKQYLLELALHRNMISKETSVLTKYALF